MDTIQVDARREIVLVLDNMRFRRAALHRLLDDWAARTGLELEQADPQTRCVDDAQSPSAKMVVLSLGSLSVSDNDSGRWISYCRGSMPETPLVIISDLQQPSESVNALRHGARAYIPTSIEPSIALEALSFILAGGSFFPPTALLSHYGHGDGQRASDSSPRRKRDETRLTPRQESVLALLSSGMSNKLIARHLNLRESTVKVHLRQIMKRLGAANRTEAALLGYAIDLSELNGRDSATSC